MGTTIGRTSAIISADSTEFTKAYNAAEQGLSKFASSITSVNEKIETLAREKEHAAEAGHGGILQGLLEFEAIKEGLAIAKEFTVELVKSSFESIDALSKMAEKTGLTTEALSRLQFAAKLSGVDAEGLTSSLVKMTKNLYEAANGGAPEVQKALESLGLDARALASSSPEEAFKAIAAGMAEVGNAGEANSAAMALFGKAGADLRPLLNQGAEGIEKMFEESDRLGNTINGMDAKKVEEANDAVEKLVTAVHGVANAVAIDLAPYVTAVANQLTEWGTAGGGAGKTVVDAIEWSTRALAQLADYGEILVAGWYTLRAGAAAAFAGIVGSIDVAGGALVKLLDLIPGVDVTWTSSFRDLSRGLMEEANKQWDKAGEAMNRATSGENSKAVNKFFADARQHAEESAQASMHAATALGDVGDAAEEEGKKVGEILERMRKEVAQFGLTDAQKQLEELKAAGASDDSIAEAEGLQSTLDALKAEKKAREDATKAAEEYYKATRDPAEKYAAEVERINELLVQGYLDAETAQRAADKAATDYANATQGGGKDTKTDAPKLLQAGSQAAASFVSQIQRNQRGADPAEKSLKKLGDISETSEKQLAALEQLNATLESIGAV